MDFFKNRAYQKSVREWMGILLGMGKGQVAENIWKANPSLKADAAAFRQDGQPAILAAAELWRRIFTEQLIRQPAADQRAIFDYLAGDLEEAPNRLAVLCLFYCQELDRRAKMGDIETGLAEIYTNEILQAALGRDSEERTKHRLVNALHNGLLDES